MYHIHDRRGQNEDMTEARSKVGYCATVPNNDAHTHVTGSLLLSSHHHGAFPVNAAAAIQIHLFMPRARLSPRTRWSIRTVH